MQRIALEATLDTPLGLLRVTTTHLEYYSAAQRYAQMERLRDLQREGYGHAGRSSVAPPTAGPFCYPPRGKPAILCGDFNSRPGAVDRARLAAPFDDGTPQYRDAWELAHPGQAPAPTMGLYDKAQ